MPYTNNNTTNASSFSFSYAGTTSMGWWPPIVSHSSFWAFPPETDAARRAREAREAEAVRQQTELQQRAGALARERAEALLQAVLGDGYADYQHDGHVDVGSQRHVGRLYRLRPGAMIEVLDGEHVVDRLCIHPQERLPDADELLAQLLLAQHDEARLLQVAIRHAA